MNESEWRTRKRRIDPELDAAGWRLPPDGATPLRDPYRSEEEETDNSPADYALWLDHHVVGIVEGKPTALADARRAHARARLVRLRVGVSDLRLDEVHGFEGQAMRGYWRGTPVFSPQ